MDREKVLTWLEICGKNNDCSGCCPYSENGFGEYGQCRESLMADAYDLLKEQEAVEPKPVDLYGKDEWLGLVCVCPDCKAEWMSDKADTHFCPKCGQAVKWE